MCKQNCLVLQQTVAVYIVAYIKLPKLSKSFKSAFAHLQSIQNSSKYILLQVSVQVTSCVRVDRLGPSPVYLSTFRAWIARALPKSQKPTRPTGPQQAVLLRGGSARAQAHTRRFLGRRLLRLAQLTGELSFYCEPSCANDNSRAPPQVIVLRRASRSQRILSTLLFHIIERL